MGNRMKVAEDVKPDKANKQCNGTEILFKVRFMLWKKRNEGRGVETAVYINGPTSAVL